MKALLKQILKTHGLDVLVFLDYETFYKTRASGGDKSFSLSSKTYAEYLFDDRFHITGLGFVTNDNDPIGYAHEPAAVEGVHWWLRELTQTKRVGVVAHNTAFDGAISHWLHGIKFAYYFDTKLMSLCIDPSTPNALKDCCLREFPDDPSLQKGGAELVSVDGIKYPYISEEQHIALADYCRQDVNLTRRLFFKYYQRLLDMGLSLEIEAQHLTLRGHIEPQFAIRRDLLEEVMEDKKHERDEAISLAIKYCWGKGIPDITAKTFSSNPQYAKLLVALGCKVPTKISPTTGKQTEALGQGDPDYIKMMIANADLAHIFAARKVAKSNIEYTRASRMITVADMFDAQGFDDVDMPFFLNYYGAGQTGRWSGSQKLNQQNNTRGGKHRLSMLAPEGFLIGVCDLSNIELRVNLWFCGQDDLLQMFADDPDFDLYSAIASDIFRRPINKKENKNERQTGKAAALGLGFSMGWFGFQQYLASGPLGMKPMFESDAFCRNVKTTYDIKHYKIVEMWHFLQNMIIPVLIGDVPAQNFGPNNLFRAEKDAVHLPSGRILRYKNTRVVAVEDKDGYTSKVLFDSNKFDRFGNAFPKYLWRGLLLENIIQATARDILCEQLVGINTALESQDLGWLMGSVHDEALCAIKEDKADEAYAVMESLMSRGPAWCEQIPLANEGGYAKEYSK